MRIRIALTTAVAVIVSTGAVFMLLGSNPAGSAWASTHHQVRTTQHTKLEHTALVSFSVPTTPLRAHTLDYGVPAAELAATFPPKPAVTPAAAAAPVRVVVPVRAAAPAPAPTPVATPAPASGSDATSTDTADWACIREHESGDNYSEPGGGAYQFEGMTWADFDGYAEAEEAPPAVQDQKALLTYRERGWEPWSTRYVCGL